MRTLGGAMGSVIVTFCLFLLGFTAIGVYSATRKKNTTEDYLVASRTVRPWAMALSAVSTNNSGFMFIGLIGETYAVGVSAMWLMVGWIFGEYLTWLAGVQRRLRERSEAAGVVTVPSFLGANLDGGRIITSAAGLLTLLFLGVYAAAQLKAGGKALHALFHWDHRVGAIVGAAIVAIYCMSGGIRASIWTDVAQSIVMMISMVLLFAVGLFSTGGFAGLWQKLAHLDPALVNIVPRDLKLGFVLFFFGWMTAGLGVVGQPHIMVRPMALNSAKHMGLARRIYISWYVVFSAAAIGVGLVARVLIDAPKGFDPELAMPTLSTQLLPGPLVGLVLAGLFAATMSTADSQVLSCSAALTQDIFPRLGKRVGAIKGATLLATFIALGLALGESTVFGLVVLAWSSLASCLGPLMVLRTLDKRVTTVQALTMMGVGLLAVLGWRYGLRLSGDVYDVLPGMSAGFAAYFLWPGLRSKHPSSRSSQSSAAPHSRVFAK